jgi:hypothetical protein
VLSCAVVVVISQDVFYIKISDLLNPENQFLVISHTSALISPYQLVGAEVGKGLRGFQVV